MVKKTILACIVGLSLASFSLQAQGSLLGYSLCCGVSYLLYTRSRATDSWVEQGITWSYLRWNDYWYQAQREQKNKAALPVVISPSPPQSNFSSTPIKKSWWETGWNLNWKKAKKFIEEAAEEVVQEVDHVTQPWTASLILRTNVYSTWWFQGMTHKNACRAGCIVFGLLGTGGMLRNVFGSFARPSGLRV